MAKRYLLYAENIRFVASEHLSGKKKMLNNCDWFFVFMYKAFFSLNQSQNGAFLIRFCFEEPLSPKTGSGAQRSRNWKRIPFATLGHR